MRPKKLKCRKKEGISKWMGKRFGHPLIFLTKCCLGEIGNGKIINRFLRTVGLSREDFLHLHGKLAAYLDEQKALNPLAENLGNGAI